MNDVIIIYIPNYTGLNLLKRERTFIKCKLPSANFIHYLGVRKLVFFEADQDIQYGD